MAAFEVAKLCLTYVVATYAKSASAKRSKTRPVRPRKAHDFSGVLDSLFASDFVSFLRGTAPFTNLALRDQTVNRVWQGGLKLEPLRRLGISITGNYVRSTGLGEIAGELPLYGPMKFPYATGSIYYDIPQLGRLAVQLQRTYYLEQIVPGNNFSANLVTIAWTRGF